jgi:hypothetical protein
MIDKPGIFRDMSPADYFADPCPQPSLTQSIAKVLIDRSPAHARLEHPRLNPERRDDGGDYSKALAIGNAAHKLILGRGKQVHVIDAPDFRTGSAKSARDAAALAGFTPILQKHHSASEDLAIAVRRQLNEFGLVRAFREGCGNGEVVIAWQEDGVWFRSMIDWVDNSSPTCFDLKTSGRSAAPHAVPQTMAEAGWPIQAAFQERGLDVLDPDNAGRRRFLFVMVENEPPYAVSVHELTKAVMMIGRKQLAYAVRTWRDCIESGDWPAYPPLINMPEYPGWREHQWLAREIAEFEGATRRDVREAMLTDLAGG